MLLHSFIFPRAGAMAALILASFVMGGAGNPPRVYPTGVTVYDPARAYNSFISFSGADGNTHLIDMDGNEVHRWPHEGLPGDVIDPRLVGGARGHVLLQLSRNDDPRGGIFTHKTVGELDWAGQPVWTWGGEAPGGSARQNHDWARLPNGNTLLLVAILVGAHVHREAMAIPHAVK